MKTVAHRVPYLLFAGAALLAYPLGSQTAPPREAPAAANSEAPAIAPAKEALIQRLLELTGAANMGQQMMDGMITSFRQASPEIPEEFWRNFRNEVDVNSLMQKIKPIYDRYLSEEDLKGLVAFYESPLGRKLISQMPAILRESMAVGQEWGMAAGQRAMQRVEEEKKKLKSPKDGGKP